MSFRSHRYISTLPLAVYENGYNSRETMREYGYGDAAASEESSGGGIEAYIPAVKKLLGIDDPRDQLPVLEAKLAILQAGGPAAVVKAWEVGAVGNVSLAIQKVQGQIDEVKRQASQVKTRDMLITAGAAAGVGLLLVGGAYLAVKTIRAARGNE